MKPSHLNFIKKAIELLNSHAEQDFVSRADAKEASEKLLEIIEYQKMTMESPVKRIINEILNEVEYAESKHPDWPLDKVYAAAIVCEESGELMREAVQIEMENGDIDRLRVEAIKTAATCIRLISNINV